MLYGVDFVRGAGDTIKSLKMSNRLSLWAVIASGLLFKVLENQMFPWFVILASFPTPPAFL